MADLDREEREGDEIVSLDPAADRGGQYRPPPHARIAQRRRAVKLSTQVHPDPRSATRGGFGAG